MPSLKTSNEALATAGPAWNGGEPDSGLRSTVKVCAISSQFTTSVCCVEALAITRPCACEILTNKLLKENSPPGGLQVTVTDIRRSTRPISCAVFATLMVALPCASANARKMIANVV
jgi:hypothetical protein